EDEVSFVKEITKVMRNKPIIAAGKTTLRQFSALVKKSNLFIGVDSGPIHIAAAMKIPVVALFGAADPDYLGPYGNNHIVITKRKYFPCSPCAQTVCLRPAKSCMQAITVDEVWQTVKKQMERIEKARRLEGGGSIQENGANYTIENTTN
ncbi:MAG: hypothetical protein COS84_05880, partial [Armatimonadetes bacterium CG07_land_8_20_14_0_80_40_9]